MVACHNAPVSGDRGLQLGSMGPVGPMGQRAPAGRPTAGQRPGSRHAHGDRRPAGGGRRAGSGGRNTKHKLEPTPPTSARSGSKPQNKHLK